MILRLKSLQLQYLREETHKVHPIEACALLFGKMTEKQVSLESIIITRNVLASNIRFEIDPKAFYDALTQADKEGLEFIGFFHSHPAVAYPSSIDIKFMRLWGDAIWLILSSTDNGFAAFQIIDEKVQAIEVKTNNA